MTAVEYLFEEILKLESEYYIGNIGRIDLRKKRLELFEQAKEMEAKEMYSKEEVIEAHALGMDYYAEPNEWDKVTPKQKLENLLNKKQ
jgi:hypothetical protein